MKTWEIYRKILRALAATALLSGAYGMPTLAISGEADAPAAPTIPTAPIFVNSVNWSPSAGFGSGAPRWYKETGFVDPDVVHLQGAARQNSSAGADANLLGTLPAAASPDRIVYAIVHTFNGTYADIAIQPDGQILLIGPRPPAVKDYSFVSLEGITYEQFLPVPNPVVMNTTNWSPNAGFGSSAPAWYQDGNFYVHLQGAAKQIFSGSNLLGTIRGAQPNRNVFTIVHTFNGTYADISIGSNGQIGLIDPRPPAVKDYSFVSLEGIAYHVTGALNAIPVNTANWSVSAGFGSTPPAWEKDAGIVHLTGAAKQRVSTGANANLLGFLPLAVTPKRDVFTIVHTFNGTYADISISTTGVISLINPRPPAVKDYSFVSLEGISYQQ
jgi:hypothetical protein